MHSLHFLGHVAIRLVQYAVTLRVPLAAGAFLLVFPWLAFHRLRELFRGLYDLTPGSLFLATLAAAALAGAVLKNGWLFYARMKGHYPRGAVLYKYVFSPTHQAEWMLALFVLCLPTLIGAIALSRKTHSAAALLGSAFAGLAIAEAFTWALLQMGTNPLLPAVVRLEQTHPGGFFLRHVAMGNRYCFADQFSAASAFLVTLLFWIILGVYGYRSLGKPKTVPALASFYLLATMVTWLLGGLAFTLDTWNIPLLLVVVTYGVLTALTSPADHTYRLVPLSPDAAPDPADTLLATGAPGAILVAAEGGGIQAAAWAAQVLKGLRDKFGGRFDDALRMISSVSGGSVGCAFYVDWLLHPDSARNPVDSAAASSLDEAAWGLAWPDFLRSILPWFFSWTIDRAHAIETAWANNGSIVPGQLRLTRALSAWRSSVTAGPKIPAIIMNSTVVEDGSRVLMGTSVLERCLAPLARIDASALNRIDETVMDVSAATAARLSASFTWVSPAARAEKNSRRPHLVDGGYYDNYGMATLVEWLDEALNGAMNRQSNLKRVLVIQLHCSPVDGDVEDRERRAAVKRDGFSAAMKTRPRKPSNSDAELEHGNRGWFFQLFAPILAVLGVRSAGQIAHNDIELEMLQAKWREKGIEITTVPFVFPDKNAPLSWHLIQEQKDAIHKAWATKMHEPIRQVEEFLHPTPPPPPPPSPAAVSAAAEPSLRS
jgi:hypothetical protein